MHFEHREVNNSFFFNLRISVLVWFVDVGSQRVTGLFQAISDGSVLGDFLVSPTNQFA